MVEWKTDCSNKLVEFKLKAKGRPKWLALGLVAAGGVKTKVDLPDGKIPKLDIVLGDSRQLIDGTVNDFVLPASGSEPEPVPEPESKTQHQKPEGKTQKVANFIKWRYNVGKDQSTL